MNVLQSVSNNNNVGVIKVRYKKNIMDILTFIYGKKMECYQK